MRDYSNLFGQGLWGAGHFGRGPGGGRGDGRSSSGFAGGRFPFGNFQWPFPPRRGGGGRARRGDVRAGILALLAEAPRNGYQIMQELEERSRGLWRPSPGSVYPALQQLEDEGLVRSEEAGTGRVYQLTDQGRTYVSEHRSETDAPWDWAKSDGDEELFELFNQIRHIGGALWQIANSGQPEHLTRARKVLSDARRALYNILSEDPEADEPDAEDR
ncbi:MAG TPA: PadR family transcriptional regulator [Polyangiaceae bacterium]|nr:PadR family transcriptional regulator [Polyangiaceae bacterium]